VAEFAGLEPLGRTCLVWWLFLCLFVCLEVQLCPVAQAALILGIPCLGPPRAGMTSVLGACRFVCGLCTSLVDWVVVCEIACIRIDSLYRGDSLGQAQ
jgi:hypothetical protein